MIAALPSWFGLFFGGARQGDERGRARPRSAPSTHIDARMPAGHPDTELVARVRHGGRVAFDRIVQEQFAAMARCAYHVTRSRDDAEDLAQEVLVALWYARAQWLPVHGIRAYLLAAVRRRALNRVRNLAIAVRHERTVQDTLHGHAEPTPLQHVVAGDTNETLDAALVQLSERAREAVLLRYDSGHSFPEIAQILGISLAAAQKIVQRATAQLRTLLTRDR